MAVGEEDRRGEVGACWSDGPGRLEVEEVGEELREGLAEAEEGRRLGMEVDACCRERGREGQRMMEQAGGERSSGLPLS